MAQHFDDHSKLGSPRGAVHIIFRRTQGKLELVSLSKRNASDEHHVIGTTGWSLVDAILQICGGQGWSTFLLVLMHVQTGRCGFCHCRSY